MIITVNVYGNEFAMTVLEDDNGNIFMLTPKDGKIQDYVQTNKTLKFVMNNVHYENYAYLDDTPEHIEAAFNKFNENGQNWFKELTDELLLVVCEME